MNLKNGEAVAIELKLITQSIEVYNQRKLVTIFNLSDEGDDELDTAIMRAVLNTVASVAR